MTIPATLESDDLVIGAWLSEARLATSILRPGPPDLQRRTTPGEAFALGFLLAVLLAVAVQALGHVA